MPTPTYTPLANITLAATASSVAFSSIPATYRDLIIVVRASMSSAVTTALTTKLNNDSGANYSFVFMANGNGSTSSYGEGGVTSLSTVAFADLTNTQITTSQIQVMDYSATDKHKTVLVRADRVNFGTSATANRWANTAAVTSVNFSVASGAMAIGSTFSLYGIAS